MGNKFMTFPDKAQVSFSELEISKEKDILVLEDESIMFSRNVANRLSCDLASYPRKLKHQHCK
jgi:hypothetical protein